MKSAHARVSAAVKSTAAAAATVAAAMLGEGRRCRKGRRSDRQCRRRRSDLFTHVPNPRPTLSAPPMAPFTDSTDDQLCKYGGSKLNRP
jgi:hypothetical protein